jgi:2-polyprenyl-6-methoxyphenol hydroxylase-like FAD-dependent oxidoreductase
MPDSLRDLALLGVEIQPEDGASFQGIRFVHHQSARDGAVAVADVATAAFPANRGSGAGVGLRRQALHARLVARAEEVGVHLRWESQVQLKEAGQVLVAGEACGYDWLIGADGQSSQVRRWAGLERGVTLSRRFGFRQHFAVEPWSPYVEVHWGRSGQAYVTPTGPHEVCVATVARDPHCRVQAILDEMPQLRERLCATAQRAPEGVDNERGSLTTTRRLARVARGRVVLVGDASGSADAITGEGMGMGFRQALLLAECLDAGDLVRYNRMHSGILKLPQTMARVMLLMDRSSGFRDRALRMLTAEPAIFARLLGVHLGAESFGRFVAAKGVEVAWRLAVQRPAPATQGALA